MRYRLRQLLHATTKGRSIALVLDQLLRMVANESSATTDIMRRHSATITEQQARALKQSSLRDLELMGTLALKIGEKCAQVADDMARRKRMLADLPGIEPKLTEDMRASALAWEACRSELLALVADSRAVLAGLKLSLEQRHDFAPESNNAQSQVSSFLESESKHEVASTTSSVRSSTGASKAQRVTPPIALLAGAPPTPATKTSRPPWAAQEVRAPLQAGTGTSALATAKAASRTTIPGSYQALVATLRN